MGIYDRDYLRTNSGGFWNALGGEARVCKRLILINVVMFILQVATESAPQRGRYVPDDEDFGPPGRVERRVIKQDEGFSVTDALQLDVERVKHGEVWRLFTYAFLHDPSMLFHILFNMLFLYWFGRDLEDLYGPREFLLFYLAAALLGGIAFVLGNMAGVPGKLCVGASGAVMAVMVLCAFHYPQRSILVFFLIPIPIWVCIIYMIATDAFTLIRALKDPDGVVSNVAVGVHLAGAAFAAAYYEFNWRLSGLLGDLDGLRKRLSRPRLRVYREEETPTHAPAATAPRRDVDEHMEAQVDAVLEKVARSGQASLTEHERQVLLRASELYRRRKP